MKTYTVEQIEERGWTRRFAEFMTAHMSPEQIAALMSRTASSFDDKETDRIMGPELVIVWETSRKIIG